MALQQARAKTHVTVRFNRDWQVDDAGVRKARAGLEIALTAVQLTGGIDQEIDDRRRKTLASDQHGLGSEEAHLTLGDAQPKIDGPGRQRHRRNVSVPSLVSL